jgi:hypothetical protein
LARHNSKTKMYGNSYDCINIGSNGFAQLGDPLYREKNAVEMKVLMDHLETWRPVPSCFQDMARFKVMGFEHDFGRYHEIVIRYNQRILQDWEDSDDEDKNELHDKFWDWANECEGVDLESEDLTLAIEREYFKSLDKEKGEHLQVIKAA